MGGRCDDNLRPPFQTTCERRTGPASVKDTVLVLFPVRGRELCEFDTTDGVTGISPGLCRGDKQLTVKCSHTARNV